MRRRLLVCWLLVFVMIISAACQSKYDSPFESMIDRENGIEEPDPTDFHLEKPGEDYVLFPSEGVTGTPTPTPWELPSRTPTPSPLPTTPTPVPTNTPVLTPTTAPTTAPTNPPATEATTVAPTVAPNTPTPVPNTPTPVPDTPTPVPDTPTPVPATPTPEATETPTPTPRPTFAALAVTLAEDEGEEVTVYSTSDAFPNLINQYWGSEYTSESVSSSSYVSTLDAAFASGEGIPDIFVCDQNTARRYINSEYILPVNELGISNDELDQMYYYTLQFGADSNGVIRALTWEANPCGVFYNRDIAIDYIGIEEPEDMAVYFSSWSAFMQTARLVNSESSGAVRVVSGTDDIYRMYLAGRSNQWIVNGSVNVDPVAEAFFDVATALAGENLTFGTTRGDEAWQSNTSNGSVLSYFGSLQMASSNLNSGRWALVPGPVATFESGSWILVSASCDNRTSCANIVRNITLDHDNLVNLADSGVFVNSNEIMGERAGNSDYELSWLGGQNPYATLLTIANDTNVRERGADDSVINTEFNNFVNAYINEEYETIADTIEAFTARMIELGLANS